MPVNDGDREKVYRLQSDPFGKRTNSKTDWRAKKKKKKKEKKREKGRENPSIKGERSEQEGST